MSRSFFATLMHSRTAPILLVGEYQESGVANSREKRGVETFGARLALLRRAAGYSQRELAAETGISYRMIAYYESHPDGPPAKLLPMLGRALGVTTDELLGIKPVRFRSRRRPQSRLWRRFQEVERLPPTQRRQVVQFIDAFLDRERLRGKLQGEAATREG
jgi:transcriptional regulator with XRE-family HTH domain